MHRNQTIIAVFAIIYSTFQALHLFQISDLLQLNDINIQKRTHDNSPHVAIVSCGLMSTEVYSLLNSILLYTDKHIIFHFVFEYQNRIGIIYWLQRYKNLMEEDKFQFHFYEPKFPNDGIEWREEYAPCSFERLFLPEILKDVDNVIYLDTDFIVLNEINELWKNFKNFDQHQLIGATAISENRKNNYFYEIPSSSPFYKPYGMQAGLLLMNLTRMREINISSKWATLFVENKDKYVPFGDQDVINIFFSTHPSYVYDIDCEWNYRILNCISNCKVAPDGQEIKTKMKAIHAVTNAFHKNSLLYTFQRFFSGMLIPPSMYVPMLKDMVRMRSEKLIEENDRFGCLYGEMMFRNFTPEARTFRQQFL